MVSPEAGSSLTPKRIMLVHGTVSLQPKWMGGPPTSSVPRMRRFSLRDTNLVLRKFEKCGVILRHHSSPREGYLYADLLTTDDNLAINHLRDLHQVRAMDKI